MARFVGSVLAPRKLMGLGAAFAIILPGEASEQIIGKFCVVLYVLSSDGIGWGLSEIWRDLSGQPLCMGARYSAQALQLQPSKISAMLRELSLSANASLQVNPRRRSERIWRIAPITQCLRRLPQAAPKSPQVGAQWKLQRAIVVCSVSLMRLARTPFAQISLMLGLTEQEKIEQWVSQRWRPCRCHRIFSSCRQRGAENSGGHFAAAGGCAPAAKKMKGTHSRPRDLCALLWCGLLYLTTHHAFARIISMV
jgi:hypothetical protein